MICGYLIEENKRDTLKKLGVKDSKRLTDGKRQNLYSKLKTICDDYLTAHVSPVEIDRLRDITNLNRIEISYMVKIINKLRPDKVIIDSPETNTENFTHKIRSRLTNKNIEIVAENFADRNHLEVSAASIIAKVERDRKISKLAKKYGNIGSGYTSDPLTIDFLKNWIKVNKEFPEMVRKSWITARELKTNKQQRKISEYNEDKRVF